MSDGDPALDKALRWMSIYDFNFRIFTLKKHQTQANKVQDTPFGK